MAHVLKFFMVPEDEVAFFRYLERYKLEVYPVRVPPDWKPFPVNADTMARVPDDAAYLAASALGEVMVDKVKRGPNKGDWRVDEVRSPVIYFERSVRNETEELVSGRLWAELDITDQTGRKNAAPDRFRLLFLEIQEHLRKTFRKSEPMGFLVGPHAARRFKEGMLVLRDSQHRGGTVRPFR